MKRRIIAILLGVAVAWPVMLLVGFADPWIGYVAGVVAAEAVYL